MAEHKAEQVAAAIQTLVTNLTTAGNHVERGRADTVPAESTPALRIATGDDTIVDPWAPQLLDSELEVSVFAVAYDSQTNIETLLMRMRKEVTVALMADYTLGLAFVHSIVELGARKRDIATADGAKPGGSLECMFRVKYRRSRTDPSA